MLVLEYLARLLEFGLVGKISKGRHPVFRTIWVLVLFPQRLESAIRV